MGLGMNPGFFPSRWRELGQSFVLLRILSLHFWEMGIVREPSSRALVKTELGKCLRPQAPVEDRAHKIFSTNTVLNTGVCPVKVVGFCTWKHKTSGEMRISDTQQMAWRCALDTLVARWADPEIYLWLFIKPNFPCFPTPSSARWIIIDVHNENQSSHLHLQVAQDLVNASSHLCFLIFNTISRLPTSFLQPPA